MNYFVPFMRVEGCEKLDRNLKCKTLQSILTKSETSLLEELPLGIQAVLIANGLCIVACARVREQYKYNKENVSKYVYSHPVFKNKEERDECRKKLEEIKNRSMVEVVVTTEFMGVLNLILRVSNQKTAIALANSYVRGKVSAIEIARFYLLHSTYGNIVEKKSKEPIIFNTKFKPLTEEQGYNINVEELL